MAKIKVACFFLGHGVYYNAQTHTDNLNKAFAANVVSQWLKC